MTYDRLSNEVSEVSCVSGVTENTETERRRCFHGLFGIKKRRKWVKSASDNQKVIFYLWAGGSETMVSKGRASSLVTSSAVRRVADTRKHEMCYWSERPLTQKCEDGWRAAAAESTHELVEWGKPITVCDHELWRESESWVFLSPACPRVVFSMIYCTVSLSMNRENLEFTVSNIAAVVCNFWSAVNILTFVWSDLMKLVFCSICEWNKKMSLLQQESNRLTHVYIVSYYQHVYGYLLHILDDLLQLYIL